MYKSESYAISEAKRRTQEGFAHTVVKHDEKYYVITKNAFDNGWTPSSDRDGSETIVVWAS